MSPFPARVKLPALDNSTSPPEAPGGSIGANPVQRSGDVDVLVGAQPKWVRALDI